MRLPISYIVHNLTTRTIVLADLRAEIGPHKMLDLEKVADRTDIDRSYDLRTALNTSRIRLCGQGKKPNVQIVEKIIEQHHHHEQEHHHHETSFDEAKLMAMMQKVMQENKTASSSNSNQQILDAVANLKEQIESIGHEEHKSELDLPIDPEKLANLQSRAVDKLSQDIETGNVKSGRKVILKNTRLGDLADELD